jgi:hypothetical protein
MQHVKLLLAGCGDIRNLLATVAGLHALDTGSSDDSSSNTGVTRTQQLQQRRLSFVLNDGNISMLARDAVMLHMIAEQQASAEAVLAVWANHALTDEQHALVLASCRALAEQPWPAWLSAACTLQPNLFDRSHNTMQQQQQQQHNDIQGGKQSEDGDDSLQSSKVNNTTAVSGGSAAERAVRAACAAWCSCTLSLKELLQEREDRKTSAKTRQYAVELSLTAAAAAAHDAANSSNSSSSSSSVKVSKKLQKDITQYIQTGSLQQGTGASKVLQNKPNLTLLKAPELQYAVYFSSSIFRAVALPHGTAPASAAVAAELLLATVGPQVAAAAAALQQGRLDVVLVPGEILTVATKRPAPQPDALAPTHTGAAAAEAGDTRGAATCASVSFDYIDTSNVSDYT